MKIIAILMFVLTISPAILGQEILDNRADSRVEYELQYKKDTNSSRYLTDLFYLDICGNQQSFFYSRKTQFRDSIRNAMLQNGENNYDILEEIRTIPKGAAWYLNKNFKYRKFTYYYNILKEISYSTNELTIPTWNFTNDTLTINGALCYKAIAQMLGREWIAWYDPSIAINDGPWILWGLPGLIVRAYDSNKYFIFECMDYGKLPYKTYTNLAHDNIASIKTTLEKVVLYEKLLNENPDELLMILYNAKMVGEKKTKKYNYISIINHK